PSYFLFLQCTALVFWESLTTGSDMPVIGMTFILTTIALFALVEGSTASAGGTALALTLGALTLTTRVVFIYFVGVYFFLLLVRGIARSLKLAIALGLAALAINGIFLVWCGNRYAPMHVIGKGNTLLPGSVK